MSKNTKHADASKSFFSPLNRKQPHNIHKPEDAMKYAQASFKGPEHCIWQTRPRLPKETKCREVKG